MPNVLLPGGDQLRSAGGGRRGHGAAEAGQGGGAHGTLRAPGLRGLQSGRAGLNHIIWDFGFYSHH